MEKPMTDLSRRQVKSKHRNRGSRLDREPLCRISLCQIPSEAMAGIQEDTPGRARLHGKLSGPCKNPPV